MEISLSELLKNTEITEVKSCFDHYFHLNNSNESLELTIDEDLVEFMMKVINNDSYYSNDYKEFMLEFPDAEDKEYINESFNYFDIIQYILNEYYILSNPSEVYTCDTCFDYNYTNIFNKM